MNKLIRKQISIMNRSEMFAPASRGVYPCGIQVKMTRRPNQQIDFAVPQRATGAFSQRRLKQAFAPDTAG
ncbi:MAG TPA: hypothetical protein VGM05_29825, partial [Planctomycetaceae bacterium]